MNRKIPRMLVIRIIQKFSKRRRQKPLHTVRGQDALSLNLVTSWNKQCGIATYSAFLVAELKKRNQIYVIDLQEKNPCSPYFFIQGWRAGCIHDLVHVQFEYGLFSSLKLGKKTLTAFTALPFYLGLALGNRAVVTTIHEPRKAVTATGKSGLFYTKLLDNLIFSVSTLLIVHTKESKQVMKRLYGVSESKLRVIPHGSLQQHHILNKDESKLRLGLQGKTVVTILGFVTPKKGVDLVIPLLSQLSPNVQLVVAGGPQNMQDERYLAELKKQAERFGSRDRVTFTGYLPDQSVVLNATDIAILPYRTVTDSGILHILVSYKIPTVASNVRAFREVYEEYGCLELFRKGDAQDLLAKLKFLLSDEQRRDLLRTKCQAMWDATKWSTIAQKHVDLYREVLSPLA